MVPFGRLSYGGGAQPRATMFGRDEIAVDLPEGSRRFRVTGSQVVRWDASGIQTHDGGAPRIALVTCWPLDARTPGPMRYVLWAELIPEPLSASTPSQV